MNAKKKLEPGSTADYVRKFFDGGNGFTSEQFDDLLTLPLDRVNSVLRKLGMAANRLVKVHPIPDWASWRRVSTEPNVDILDKRLRWELARLQKNAEGLNEQLAVRAKIEDHIVNESLDLAHSELKDFETVHGVSLWALSTKFRLAQIENGSDFNRTELMRFMEADPKKKRRWWSKFLAQMFSNQADELLTTHDYNESVSYLRANDKELGDYSLNYLRFRLLSELPISDKAATDILHYESRHSLLDVYDTLTVILAGRIDRSLPADIVEGLVSLATLIKDPSIALIASAYSPSSTSLGDYPHFLNAYDTAFSGDYTESFATSIDLIESHPRYFGAYQLAAMCMASTRTELPVEYKFSITQRKLIEALRDWYSSESDRKQALEQLRRLARLFAGTIMGWSLHAFIESYDGSFSSLCSDRPFLLAAPTQLPQHALRMSEGKRSAAFLDAFGSTTISESTLRALRVLCDPDAEDEIAKINFPFPSRKKHLEAVVAAQDGKFSIACSLLVNLRIEFPEYYFSRPETQILESECLFEIERFEEAAMLTGSLYATNPNAVPPAQLKRFQSIITDDEHEVAQDNICWAIIAEALRRNEDVSVNLDRVHDFVSDYIESQGFQLPTELLRESLETLDHVKFAFFRDCCRPEIMESSIWIENQQELFKERLELCEKIRDHVGQPPGIEGEIGLLMRKLAVIDITQRIERSKIFVDCEKIGERVPDSLRDTIRRLLTIVALKSNEVQQGLKLLGMPDRDGGKVLVVSVNSGFELFRNVFDTLKDQYLFSPELGLDANLSQSIRHGPIISGIRTIFDKSKFVTRKNSDGAYADNEHWVSTFTEAALQQKEIQGAFTQFSQDVDRFIQYVRSDAIQIRSDNCKSGLFQFDFCDEELQDVLNRVEPFHDVEDVVNVVLQALKERTESCLAEIQQLIRDDWHDQLMHHLQVLREQVESCVVDQTRLSTFRTAVTDCGTEIPRGLDKIAAWFAQEDTREHKPFQIKSLVQSFELIATKSGQNCNAKYSGALEHDDPSVAGEYFRPLWDLFFNLFDNAIKHSGLERVELKVEATLTDQDTYIQVANPLSSKIDVDELRKKVDQLNALSLDRKSDLSKLRLEGGSGIAKLHKIVRHEIGDNIRDYTIRFQISEVPEFVATLQFPVRIIS